MVITLFKYKLFYLNNVTYTNKPALYRMIYFLLIERNIYKGLYSSNRLLFDIAVTSLEQTSDTSAVWSNPNLNA